MNAQNQTRNIQRALDDETLAQHIGLLDKAAKDYALAETFTQVGSLSHALKLAQGIRALRELLTDDIVEELLIPLRGTKLGFLTDRDKPRQGEPYDPYGINIVRDVTIEALIRGFQPVGNEFNIISDGFYAAKNGLARKLREYPGLTDMQPRPGRVTLSQDGSNALVAFTIDYKLNGVVQQLKRDQLDPKDPTTDSRVQVRVNRHMGYDALIGKAHRKTMALLIDHLTGSTLSLPAAEIGDDEAIPTTAEPVTARAAPSGEAVPKSAQEDALNDILKKHKPAPANGAPSADEAAADARAHSGK